MSSTGATAGAAPSKQAAGSPTSATSTSMNGTQQRKAGDNDSDSGSDDDDDDDDEEEEEDDDDDENAWDDFDEADEELVKLPTKALFSDEILEHPEAALQHAKDHHDVDIIDFIARNQLDYTQVIRLVNYIRRNPNPQALQTLDSTSPELNHDDYMIPVIPDDPLLQIDLEELALAHQPSTSTAHPISTANNLQRRVNELEQALQTAQFQLATRQEAMDYLFKEKYGSLAGSSESEVVDSKSKGKIKDDAGYFDSYSGNEIHEMMLKDTIRTEAYRDFIVSNPSLFKGATVLDVGCGTGILSMFAAKAGAKKVFAVDASKVAYKAMRNVKENGLSDIVEVIHSKIEDLDHEKIGKVDIIISEWMGYFLLYEAMLDSVIVARDRFLKAGGLVAPSQCSIILAAVQDETVYNDTVSYWNEVYGFKMSAMLEEVYKEADVRIMGGDSVATTTQTIKDVHIDRDQVKDCDFKTEFELTVTKSGTIHGFLGWFDTFFTVDSRHIEGEESLSAPTSESREIFFSTGPFTKPTHWKQTFFLLSEPLKDLKDGDKLRGSFSYRKDVEYARGLEVEIVFGINDGKRDLTQVWIVS